jgi:hypothetical protein
VAGISQVLPTLMPTFESMLAIPMHDTGLKRSDDRDGRAQHTDHVRRSGFAKARTVEAPRTLLLCRT